MNYNPSLDGIRALSVIAVMAFHARVPGFTGGFLGVDVFFVISGFIRWGTTHERQTTPRRFMTRPPL